MPAITSDALVLRTHKLGETSKVVVLLTRERGKVRAVARGARGPRPRYQSALEPLSEVRVGLYGRQGAELYRLGECELLRSVFPALRGDPERGAALGYLAELLDAFAQEGEAEDAVYRLAASVLRAAEDGEAIGPLARYLEAWLLKLHGIYPSLARCADCGRDLGREPRRYHAPAHGFVCQACGVATGPVLDSGRRFLEEAFRRPPGEAAAAAADAAFGDLADVEALHRRLIEDHLERELRSYQVMRDVARSVRP